MSERYCEDDDENGVFDREHCFHDCVHDGDLSQVCCHCGDLFLHPKPDHAGSCGEYLPDYATESR